MRSQGRVEEDGKDERVAKREFSISNYVLITQKTLKCQWEAMQQILESECHPASRSAILWFSGLRKVVNIVLVAVCDGPDEDQA